jgi:hypothetical protein
MFKIEKERVMVHAEIVETKVIQEAVYEERGESYRLSGDRIDITAKNVTFNGYKIPKEVLKAILSGEYDGVKGIKVEYTEKHITNRTLSFSGFTIPKGARYIPADYYNNKQFRSNGTKMSVSGMPKPAGGMKSIYDTIKTPVGYRIAGYRVKRNKKSISLGCQTFKYTDIEAILVVMDSKTR